MIIVAVGLGGYFIFTEFAPEESNAISYQLGRVTKGDIKTTVSATSQVGDVDQSEITSEASGEVTKLAVEEGQEVKKGDLIAQIDTSELEEQIYQAQLAVQSAELNLEKLKEPVDEYEIEKAENEVQSAKNSLTELRLTQKNELAAIKEERAQAEYNLENLDEDAQDYDTKKTTYQNQISAADRKIGEYNLSHPLKIAEAEAKIKEAEKSLEKTKEGSDETEISLQEISVKEKRSQLADLILQKENYTIKAPRDGVIASLNIAEGESVSSGGSSASSSSTSSSSGSSSSSNALAVLTSKNKNTVVAINEVDVPNIKKDQKVNLTFDALEDLEMTGKVTKIDLIGTEDQGVVYNNVTINFDDYDERIKNGMTVNVEIITNSKEDILLVSSTAVQNGSNGDYVKLVTDNNVDMRNSSVENTNTKLENIETGITDDVNVEVVSGLEEGDVVVISESSSSDGEADSSTDDSSDKKSSSLIPMGPGAGGGRD